MGLLNRAKQVTLTTGTGTIVLGAVVRPYQSFGTAGAVDGASYSLLIEQGTDWELSTGVYSANAQTLTRILVASSTGSLLNLNGTAVVSCAAMAQDLHPYEAWSGQKTPQLSDFSIINSGGTVTSISNTTNGIMMQTQSGNAYQGCSCLKPAPSSQSYSVYCRFKTLMSMHQFNTFALLFWNSVTGHILDLEWSARLQDSNSQWNMSVLTNRWNSLSSYNSTLTQQSFTMDPLWFRMDMVNLNTVNFYVSADGYGWYQVGGSEAVSSWITSVTHIGFGMAGFNAAPTQVAVVSAFSTVALQ